MLPHETMRFDAMVHVTQGHVTQGHIALGNVTLGYIYGTLAK